MKECRSALMSHTADPGEEPDDARHERNDSEEVNALAQSRPRKHNPERRHGRENHRLRHATSPLYEATSVCDLNNKLAILLV